MIYSRYLNFLNSFLFSSPITHTHTFFFLPSFFLNFIILLFFRQSHHHIFSSRKRELSLTDSHMIQLKSINFNERCTELLEPRTNWFVNTCNIPIPSEITGLLQLEENFCLPSLNREKIPLNIKSVEDNFCKLDTHNSSVFRNKLFSFIRDIKKIGRSKTDNNIVSAFSITKKFMTNNPNIIFTKADRGNAIVALDIGI